MEKGQDKLYSAEFDVLNSKLESMEELFKLLNDVLDKRLKKVEEKLEIFIDELGSRITELEKFKLTQEAEKATKNKVYTALISILSIVSGFLGGLIAGKGGF